jgi:pimeloyl-ACP methyl ester carboxylesterase
MIAYRRQYQSPALIVCGPDGYMAEAAGRTYLRDVPNAEFHLLDAGHWALETHLEEIVTYTRDFLERVQTSTKNNQ